MRLYLDTCAIKRIFDDQTDDRTRLEALAVIYLIGLQKEQKLEIVSSTMLELENLQNPDEQRSEITKRILYSFEERIALEASVEKRAGELQDSGMSALDALHLAFAEHGQCDYFITCDDKLLRKARKVALKVRVLSVLESLEIVKGS